MVDCLYWDGEARVSVYTGIITFPSTLPTSQVCFALLSQREVTDHHQAWETRSQ